ncbi:MAG: Eco57I restriction-modification methylase domain-containing protein [Subdoligranulum variabile]|nr:Eco57I restriction-modification methylase domain-containing protein [Subdoligranulum variabile]
MALEASYFFSLCLTSANPPYQLSTSGDDNGAQAKPIYQLFVNQAIKLKARYVTMITPSRWFAGGWGLDDFREKMITCDSIKELHDFPISTDCFAGVQIKGGVSYFLYDTNYKGKCKFYTHDSSGVVSSSDRYLHEKNCDVLIRDNELIKVYHKVQEKERFIPFSKYVTGRSPFGFNTNHHGYPTRKDTSDVPYYERTGYTYMPASAITRGRENIDKYKIYISKAYGAGEGYPHQIINRPVLGESGTICSGTYLMVGPFEDKIYAQNALAYMCTKFFRALVAINKISQDASYKVYEAVPMQDFSIKWTDEMLYKKYNLEKAEIDYIETIIKPMDLNGGDT